MPDDTLFDNVAVFMPDTDSAISDREVKRFNRIFFELLDFPTTVVVEKFLAQAMSGTLDMDSHDLDNVSGIDLDGNLDMSTGAYDILVKDGETAALEIKEGENAFITIDTQNNKIIFSEAVMIAGGALDMDGNAINSCGAIDLDANLVMSTGAYDILIKDNEATALEIIEGANAYLTFDTSNGTEKVIFGKNVVIPDAGTIGSVSDEDAIAIAADGKTTFSQDANFSEDILIGDGKYIGSASDPDAIQIEADGDILLTQELHVVGPVGIGETAPGETLHLKGADDCCIRIETETDDTGYASVEYWGVLAGWDANCLAILYFDNDLTDEIGNWTWVEDGTVLFDNDPVYQGTHCFLGRNAGWYGLHAAMGADVVQTVEFYTYICAADIGGTFFQINNGAGKTFHLEMTFAGGWKIRAGTDVGFYATIDVTPYMDKWTHFAVTWDGTNVNFFLDGTRVGTQVYAWQPTGCDLYMCCRTDATWTSFQNVDQVVISDVDRAGGTTSITPTAPGVTRTKYAYHRWSEQHQRWELVTDNKEIRIDAGTADLEVIAAALNLTGAAALGDGGTTDYLGVSATGDVTFAGAAGFYPRRVAQADIPAAGAGTTQIDEGEFMLWRDTDDGKVYIVYRDADSGIVSVELT